jgi:NADPH:quinone reductase-like Zn-dependent oxidoreductase
MRAVTIPRPGGLEVLEVAELPVREPGADEVRVAVRAAAVNPTDLGFRAAGADGTSPASSSRSAPGSSTWRSAIG